jgi:hypothetical protein
LIEKLISENILLNLKYTFKIMETQNIRQKLITDFSDFIQDDTKLEVLEGVFDALKKEATTSIVPETHYLKVEEERERYLSQKTSSNSWEEVEKKLKVKHGF